MNSPTSTNHQFATRRTHTDRAGERETKLFDPCRTALRCPDSRGDSGFSSKVILTTATDRKLIVKREQPNLENSLDWSIISTTMILNRYRFTPQTNSGTQLYT